VHVVVSFIFRSFGVPSNYDAITAVSVILSILSVVGIVGNALTIAVIIKSPKLK